MGATCFILLIIGQLVAVSPMDDSRLLMSPDLEKGIIYKGLTDAEKEEIIKATDSHAGSMVESKAFVEGKYAADKLDDNCECSLSEPSCTCLFQMSFVDLNVVYAVGYNPEDSTITLLLAIDVYIIVNDRIKPKELYKPPCMRLPPPTLWMKGCFQMKISMDQSNSFTLCGTLELKTTISDHDEPITSVDFTCFKIAKGVDRLAIKDHPAGEGDVAVKNVRAVLGFEKLAQGFNSLKLARLMKEDIPDLADDDLDESFWNQMSSNDYKPTEERSGDPNNIPDQHNWWLLGMDEVPYLVILFKGFVAFELKFAQGIDDFKMIKDAIEEATDKKSANWHQTVIPNVFAPGFSCGGALLTPDKVLTICACIRSFYYYNTHKKPAPGVGSKFDIKVDGGENIFLEVSTNQFTGKQYHHLDQDSSIYDTKSSCFKLIESGSEGQQTEMVVMPFTPKIPNQNPFLYVLWPPYPIHQNYKLVPVCNVVAFGTHSKGKLNFTDFGGRVIDMKTRAVSILTKRLCEGSIGYPITNGDELAGLTASPLDCDKEGSMMGAVFSDQIVVDIETYLGKDLKTRKTAAHSYLYREPETIVHFIPDYSTSDATFKAGFAAGKRVASSTSLMILMILLIICQIFVLIK